MSFRQRKETVVHPVRRPSRRLRVVTIQTLCREICRQVVRVRRLLVIGHMAGHAVVANPVETQPSLRSMTILATDRTVLPCERKSVPLVKPLYVVHQPVIRPVAPGTVRTDRLLVNVRMATDTGVGHFLENKGCVAVPAVRCRVLPCQHKISGSVVMKKKGVYKGGRTWQPVFPRQRRMNVPAAGGMTGRTVHLERRSMRML
jgi:hypothetical protein